MLNYKKGDLLKYRDKHWFIDDDSFSYGILLEQGFIFETRHLHIKEESTRIRINEYTVYDFSMGMRLAISDDGYVIEKVLKKMNKK